MQRQSDSLFPLMLLFSATPPLILSQKLIALLHLARSRIVARSSLSADFTSISLSSLSLVPTEHRHPAEFFDFLEMFLYPRQFVHHIILYFLLFSMISQGLTVCYIKKFGVHIDGLFD